MSTNCRDILLIEDNPDDVLLTKRALKKNNILNTLMVVSDGQQAFDFLFGAADGTSAPAPVPCLVLLDLKLPKVSGLEVLQRLRAEERTRLTPVVVLTTSSEEKDLVESYSLGANSYVRKPVDFNEFVEAVQQLGMYWLLLNQPAPSPRD